MMILYEIWIKGYIFLFYFYDLDVGVAVVAFVKGILQVHLLI